MSDDTLYNRYKVSIYKPEFIPYPSLVVAEAATFKLAEDFAHEVAEVIRHPSEEDCKRWGIGELEFGDIWIVEVFGGGFSQCTPVTVGTRKED